MNKLKMHENSVVATWFNVSELHEFIAICDKFGVSIDRPWGIRKHSWNNFASNISVSYVVVIYLVVLRAAARLVLQLPYRSSVSEAMHRQLHWLDVVDRVNYKIGLLVYKCLHGLAPGYLSDQCIPASTFAGRANMRSSTRLDRLLYVPRTKTKTLGPRGFYYASSAVWNSLPVDLRDPGLSLHSFRTKLKSHFFIVD